jgi:hypothetical protein
MSKKLIAVASAAALALSALVGIAPAVATGPAASFSGVTNNGTSSAAPAEVAVPYENTLTAGSTAGLLTISNLASNDVIRITASGKARLVRVVSTFGTANAAVDVTKIGTSTQEITTDSNTNVTTHVLTTGTETETVVVTVTRTGLTSSTTLYIKGTLPDAAKYRLTDLVAPATLAKGATSVVTFKVTDVFGNQLKTATLSGVVSGDGAASAVTAATWDAALGKHKFTHTSNSNSPYILTIDLGATDIAGFADKTDEAAIVINNTGVSAQIATLTTQLAEANAKLAKRVTKKRFNTLARKWNAAFPSQKVALKK